MQKGLVTRSGLLAMQVCVHQSWTDEQIEAFANQENPTGIEPKWQIRTDAALLAGAPVRQTCADTPDRVHVMLDC